MRIMAGRRRRAGGGPLTVRIHGDVVSGFGGFGNRLACGLIEAGHEVEVMLLDRDERLAPLPAAVRERVVERPTGRRVLTVGVVLTPPLGIGQEAMLTMWEAPRLKRAWVEGLSRMRVVMAPSRQQVMLFEANGVMAPVRWAPLCVDEVYYWDGLNGSRSCGRLNGPRQEVGAERVFTFGAGGDRMHGQSRKGIDLVIRAFQREFGNGEKVRLRVKLRAGCATPDAGDDRIELVKAFLMPEQMVDFYRGCDAWVDGSRFEGWGLMQQEAQLMGLPVIGQGRIGGVSEFFQGFHVGYVLMAAQESAYAGMGSWPELDEEEMGRVMRQVYERWKAKGGETWDLLARMSAMRFDRARSVEAVVRALQEVGMMGERDHGLRTTDHEEKKREEGDNHGKHGLHGRGGEKEEFKGGIEGGALSLAIPLKMREGNGERLGLAAAASKGTQRWSMSRCPVFYHAGDIGDLIYGLLTMKKLGGGRLMVGPYTKMPPGLRPRAGIRWESYQALKPLLERQSYVKRVFYTNGLPEADYDLNEFRYYWRGRLMEKLQAAYERAGKEGPYSLAWMHLAAFGVEECDETEPWLEVPEAERITRFPVVMHRSARYHNPHFPWREVCERFAGRLTFIGFEEEYREFIKEVLPKDGLRARPVFHKVKDFWEIAQILAGCELFIGNQSSIYAVAEGLKVRTIQETRIEPEEGADCVFKRGNAQYVRDGRIRWEELKI